MGNDNNTDQNSLNSEDEPPNTELGNDDLASNVNSDDDATSSIFNPDGSDEVVTKKARRPLKQQKANSRSQGAELAGAEPDVMKNMVKVMHKRLENAPADADQDVVFGKMIAGELKSFPEHIKFRVKHDINNVIHKYKISQVDAAASCTTTNPMLLTPPGNAAASAFSSSFNTLE